MTGEVGSARVPCVFLREDGADFLFTRSLFVDALPLWVGSKRRLFFLFCFSIIANYPVRRFWELTCAIKKVILPWANRKDVEHDPVAWRFAMRYNSCSYALSLKRSKLRLGRVDWDGEGHDVA